MAPRSALASPTQYRDASVVIHLAGLAHRSASAGALAEVNARLPVRVAKAAREAGVTRFVFASSAKAAGERSGDAPLRASETPAPQSDYGRAKLAAERALTAIEGLACVSVRLPLVHGPDARANAAALIQLAHGPLPLPLASLSNRRSTISVRAAAEALMAAAVTPGPPGVFFAADAPALTPGEMIAALRAGFGRKPSLFAAPFIGVLLRATPFAALAKPFAVDDGPFRNAYGYGAQSHIDSRAALTATARAWRT